jgi:large subunit ribosomal protein L25
MSKANKTEKEELKVEKRKLSGRKVRKLRKEGLLPANIYGKKIKSLAVQLALKDFLPVWQKVGETGIVELKTGGEKEIRPVLIHNVQVDPVSDLPLHVDFHQVDLKEKIISAIPVEIVGESPAVEQKIGILIQPLDEVEVEALPTDLPDQFMVNVGSLKEINQLITVSELKVPPGVKILTSAKEVLVKIEPPAKEEVAPPAPTAEPTEEVVPGEGEKVEEKPTEEGKPVSKEKPVEEKPAAKPEANASSETKPPK